MHNEITPMRCPGCKNTLFEQIGQAWASPATELKCPHCSAIMSHWVFLVADSNASHVIRYFCPNCQRDYDHLAKGVRRRCARCKITWSFFIRCWSDPVGFQERADIAA